MILIEPLMNLLIINMMNKNKIIIKRVENFSTLLILTNIKIYNKTCKNMFIF